MTLGREDLLDKRKTRMSARSTHMANGYLAHAGPRGSKVIKIVFFIEGQRYKGYTLTEEISRLLDDKTGKVIIHRRWLKDW